MPEIDLACYLTLRPLLKRRAFIGIFLESHCGVASDRIASAVLSDQGLIDESEPEIDANSNPNVDGLVSRYGICLAAFTIEN